MNNPMRSELSDALERHDVDRPNTVKTNVSGVRHGHAIVDNKLSNSTNHQSPDHDPVGSRVEAPAVYPIPTPPVQFP